MKPIKFRCWLEKKDRFNVLSNWGMFTGWTFEDIQSGMDESNIFCKGRTLEEPNWEKLKIMQFTGLHDKNGKEIYEGDILKSVTLDNVEHFQDVYFKKGAFRLRTDFGTTLSCHLYNKRVVAHEVVGNIYENPELIKKGE